MKWLATTATNYMGQVQQIIINPVNICMITRCEGNKQKTQLLLVSGDSVTIDEKVEDVLVKLDCKCQWKMP